MHKLEAIQLEKYIKKTKIIDKISLSINSGEVVGLLGPNGAGKTTTFYMICGLISPTNGKILLDGNDISSFALHKRALLGIGYLPQESSVFKDLSVEDNLRLAAEIFYKDKKQSNQKVEEILNLLNIEPIRARKGISLSGGERRRCEIGRSLIIKPKFLLLDEPFAGVDPLAVNDIKNIIKELTGLGIGVLITDHSVREMLLVCDRAYVIKDGRELASGTSQQVANNNLVKQYYLGNDFQLF